MAEETLINPNDLPESMKDVMAMIGLDGVLLLVERFGGIRIFIPKQAGADHVLAWSLGLETATRLCRHFGGDTLTVPRATRALQQARNRRMAEQHRQGATVRELAQLWALTERRVYTILARETVEAPPRLSRDGEGPLGAPARRPPAPSPPGAGQFRGCPAPARGG